MELHTARRTAAYQRLTKLVHTPPITFDGAPPELGYGGWIAELQSALARYERSLRWEQRAHAETTEQGT